MTDITNYDIKTQKDLEQLCKDAADGCYYPPTTQMQHAMSVVIQNLVMPRTAEDFDKKQMAEWIQRKLQIAMATRAVLDGRKE